MRRLTGPLAHACTVVAALVATAGGAVSVLVACDTVRLGRVTTGSMHPGIPVGALVAGVPVRGGDLAVGDVVMFRPPEPFGDGTPVAHRVVALDDLAGGTVVRTRGDANAAADPWALHADGTTFYRVAWDSPTAGRVIALVDPGDPRAATNLLLLVAWYVTMRLIWTNRAPARHRAVPALA